MAARNLYASIFGETPETQAAYGARNTAFQDMLNQRKQAVQQQKTDDVKMAKYNALGNLITSMVQPIGWGVGGGFNASNTAGVQPYDERQYLAAFNRAVKANDDLRNIGTTEAEYNYQIANEAFQRAIAREDAERSRRQRVEDSERQINYQLEKQQRQFEQQERMKQMEIDARQALAEWKQTHQVTRKGTGISVEDRILLKELDAYNAYVGRQEAQKLPYESFEQWASKRGYQVNRVRPTATTTTSTTAAATGTGPQFNLK